MIWSQSKYKTGCYCEIRDKFNIKQPVNLFNKYNFHFTSWLNLIKLILESYIAAGHLLVSAVKRTLYLIESINYIIYCYCKYRVNICFNWLRWQGRMLTVRTYLTISFFSYQIENVTTCIYTISTLLCKYWFKKWCFFFKLFSISL
jgi:hypothetical protein